MSLFQCQFICVLKGYSCNFLRYNESSHNCIWGKVSWKGGEGGLMVKYSMFTLQTDCGHVGYSGEGGVEISVEESPQKCHSYRRNLTLSLASFSYFTMGRETLDDQAESLVRVRCEGLCLQEGYHQCNFYHFEETNHTCTWGKVISFYSES